MRVRVLNQSAFETLIDDLMVSPASGMDGFEPGRHISLDSLEAAWGLSGAARLNGNATTPGPAGRPAASGAYGDAGEAHDATMDPHAILGGLGLHQSATEAEISTLRREFAIRNHPDRVPAELRDLATRRMMIANDLLDRYLACRRKTAVRTKNSADR